MAQELQHQPTKYEAEYKPQYQQRKNFFLSLINIPFSPAFSYNSAFGFFFNWGLNSRLPLKKQATLLLQAYLYIFHFYIGFFPLIGEDIGFSLNSSQLCHFYPLTSSMFWFWFWFHLYFVCLGLFIKVFIYLFSFYIFMYLFIYWWDWELNTELHTYKVRVYCLSHTLSSFCCG
jgi:hypothetical protein